MSETPRRVRPPHLGPLPDAIEQLAGGLVTALVALATLITLTVTALFCVVGVGLLLLPAAVGLVDDAAHRERRRLIRWGHQIPEPVAVRPTDVRAATAAIRDPLFGRAVAWVVLHATLGLILGTAGVTLPLLALRDLTFPLWWRLVPADLALSSLGLPVTTWLGALAVGLLGLTWTVVATAGIPLFARVQERYGLVLLSRESSALLSERIDELTATRAAALTAHTAELRRIERALHDGAQSRLVAVVIQLGSARRTLDTRPERAAEAIEQAQAAAEDALAELRAIVRGILPPALDHHDLDGALSGLAAGCAVPCLVDVGDLGTLPSSIETTAYHVVAEAITNVTRHSDAECAHIELRRHEETLRVVVEDDGHGGAQEGVGSGLVGIRRRVEAHDGTMRVSSPQGGPTRIEVNLPCGS